jgi:hypothetical protein
MLLSGRWQLLPSGDLIPVVLAEVANRHGSWSPARFLIDSGAEITVVTPFVWRSLDFRSSPEQVQIHGAHGPAPALRVRTGFQVGPPGEPLAFEVWVHLIQSEDAIDLCLLGRNVLNHFSLLLDRPQESVLLLRGPHRYRVESDEPA